tara:strand:- start:1135 stop:1965 length:831 start_codon:yes stop_codon:yes gene_type:complete
VIKENYDISIISLTKDNKEGLERTLESLKIQNANLKIELIIVDGSCNQAQQINKKLINNFNNKINKSYIDIKYFNSRNLNIYGIFPCMNFGKMIAEGDYIIFMNSGDEFFDDNSLKLLFNRTKKINKTSSIIFGQANICSDNNLNWFFPGDRVSKIERWLRYFEPNHQAMMITNKLAKRFDFESKYHIIADGFWKRTILDHAKDIVYIKKPVCKFYLNGISSNKPSINTLVKILKNKNFSLIRKFIFVVKFFIPKTILNIYRFLQKYKSLIMDYLF